MFETRIREGVLQAQAEAARWLATGWDGGYHDAPVAYNVSVPTGWDRTDLSAYAAERRQAAEFEPDGPTLLTGVDMTHAAGARLDSIVAVATVGLSNPATLPLSPDGTRPDGLVTDAPPAGTVNLIVGTDRALDDGALATLLSVAVEAKTATLQALAGVTGTTSDAVVVGTDPGGEPSSFAGSATPVGDATRAAVRRAIVESFQSRYGDEEPPATVAAADAGIETSRVATPFEP